MAKKIDEYCIKEECGGQESCVVCASCGHDFFLDGFEPSRKEVLDQTLEELEKTNQVRKCGECDHLVIICTECSLTEPVDDGPICVCCFSLDDIDDDDDDDYFINRDDDDDF